MDKKKKKLMACTTLLGVVLPFGNIWGPFLVKCENEGQRKFRQYLVKGGVIITLINYASGIATWFYEISLITREQPLNNSCLIIWVLSSFALIILFAIINIVRQYRSNNKPLI